MIGDSVRVRVRGLSHDRERRPMLLIEDAERVLAFYVPLDAAQRLARVLGLTTCRCVPVYDLVEQAIARLDGRVVRAVLDVALGGIVGQLHIDRGGEPSVVPCHAVDAVAIALRAEAPIFASAATMVDATAERRAESAVRRWLEDLRPGDFGDTT